MKLLKYLLVTVFILLGLTSQASATSITIQSKTIPNWRYTATSGTVRIYADRTFTASNGTIVSAGNPSQTGGFYYAFNFTVAGSTATISSGTLDSTTDSLTSGGARYTAYFFSSTGVRLGPYEPFSNFSLKPIWDGLASGCSGSGTCTSWDQIAQYNSGGIPAPQDFQTYDRETIDRKINAIVASNFNFVAPLNLSGVNVSIANSSTSVDGYLSAANFTIFNNKESALTFSTGLNRSVNTITVVADTTRQLTNVKNAGSSVGTRPILNFTGSAVTSVVDTGTQIDITLQGGVDASRQIISGTGLTGGGDLSADRTLSVVADTTRQLINIKNAGTSVGTRPILNFSGTAIGSITDDGTEIDIVLNDTGGGSGGHTIQNNGSALTARSGLNFVPALVATDNSGSNRTDITIASSPVASTTLVGTGRQVLTGTGVTGGGDLSADRTISVVADSTVQKIDFQNNAGSITGTRRALQFLNNASLTFSLTDDGAGNRLQVQPTISTSPAAAATLVGTGRLISNGTGITGGGDLSADRTLSVVADSTTQRIDIQNNSGTVVGTRKALQFQNNGAITFTLTDDTGNNRIQVQPVLATSGGTNTLVTTGRQIATGTGLTGGGDLSSDRTLSVVADSTRQLINVQNGGSSVGTRPIINFSGTAITSITDDAGNNRINITLSGAGGGIATINSLNAGAQFLVVGTAGSDFNISSSVDTHTFNLPDAGASARGAINSTTQTIGGNKTFNGSTTFNGTVNLPANTTSTAVATLQTGSLLTTPTAHTIEYNGTKLYVTPSSAVRKIIATEDLTELLANKETSYPGLTAGKLTSASYITELIAPGDLTGVTGTDGSGTTIILATITSPNNGDMIVRSGGNWINQAPSGTGITTLNTLNAATQLFAVGTSGSDFNISSVTDTHTFNLPNASTTARGAINTTTQTIGGIKTFNDGLIAANVIVFAAGTTTVQPGKFQAGVLLTTPVAHSLEWDGLNLYITDNVPTRVRIADTTVAELVARKGAASGYTPLNASTKVDNTYIAEVISAADTTTWTGTDGTGDTALRTTISAPTDGQAIIRSGGNWINGSPTVGSHSLLSTTHPDTTADTPVRGDIITAQGATPLWTRKAIDTTNRVLINDGTDVAWGKITLSNTTNHVTGTLAAGNGGTGVANSNTISLAGNLVTSGANSLTLTTTGTTNVTLPTSGTLLGTAAAVTVAQGGTGLASGTSGGIPYFSGSTTMASSGALTANGVVLGGGAGTTPTATTAGSAYQPLRVPSGGGAPAFGAIDLSQSAAVTGVLSDGNIPTGFLNEQDQTSSYGGGSTTTVYTYTLAGNTLSVGTFIDVEAVLSFETVGMSGGTIFYYRVVIDGTTRSDLYSGIYADGVVGGVVFIRSRIFRRASNSLYITTEYAQTSTDGVGNATGPGLAVASNTITLDMSSSRSIAIQVVPFNNYTNASYRGEHFTIRKVGK